MAICHDPTRNNVDETPDDTKGKRFPNQRISHMKIGFIGLGAMGRAMAKTLAAGEHEVRAWNRSGWGSRGREA